MTEEQEDAVDGLLEWGMDLAMMLDSKSPSFFADTLAMREEKTQWKLRGAYPSFTVQFIERYAKSMLELAAKAGEGMEDDRKNATEKK